MPDFIQLLPDAIANQIAAGEVVQRPASALKELLENAVDAGASQIQVVIKDAGKQLIQVIDNGKGMSPTDARMSFERHATSKIRTAQDLFAIRTFGFRGEAMASIAAVAQVELKTKTQEAEVGTLIQIEGSEVKKQEPAALPIGTSVAMKNLFFNVPARRNFLKSNPVEMRHIVDEFQRVALSYPEIAFSLHQGELETYNLLPGKLSQRIVGIFGKAVQNQLVPCEESTPHLSIKGYVGKPEYAKKTRGEQFFFVNNRYIKSSYLHHAVNTAYEGLIQADQHPFYVLFLDIDPATIDINVHPTKTEIKFEEDKFIYSILLSSIRQALGKYNVMPTLDFEQETSFTASHAVPDRVRIPTIEVNPNFNPFQATNTTVRSNGGVFSEAIKNQGFGRENPSEKDWANFYSIKEEEKIENLELEFKEELDSDQNFLIRGKYLISNCRSGLLIIDVKRATERILYDELMSKFIHQPIVSQQLLFPFEKPIAKKLRKVNDIIS